jgi:hypothetical protein
VFVLDGSTFTFVPLPPEHEDILVLTQRLARRVTAFLERRFAALEPGSADVLEGAIGEAMQSLPILAADSGEEDALEEKSPKGRTRKRAASVDGFSIHAGTAVPAAASSRRGRRRRSSIAGMHDVPWHAERDAATPLACERVSPEALTV